MSSPALISTNDPVLVTGANGFIGAKVVENLLARGFSNVRCFVRAPTVSSRLGEILSGHPESQATVVSGNLLAREDCRRAAQDVRTIFHLAAGIDKLFASAFMNSVVTTRNLMDAAVEGGTLRRFVNVSSLAVYSNRDLQRGALLDESCPVDDPRNCRDAYTYSKIKQDQLVLQYVAERDVPCVTMRPGAVYGPGKRAITGRVGIDTFGIYLHLGGSNRIPLSYVDNCADAIVLAGLIPGVDGEVFNVVDDDLPESRAFLRLYKQRVRRFFSVPVPYRLTYLLCALWENYSDRSGGQLPPAFNRRRCSVEWKGNRYSNDKAKRLLGWTPRVSFAEACRRYFEYQRGEAR